LRDHYERFRSNYEQTFEKTHGFWRDVVDRVVEKFLKCGDLAKGFARIGGCGCGNELLLPFSCKCRNFCPSCHQKKVLLFGEQVRHEIVYPVPHRQYVFTIPKRLRCYFRNNRKLLGQLCLAARDSLKSFLREQLCLPDGQVGMILVIHTFGEYLGWHPHLHLLCADGLFRASGLFHCMQPTSLERLELLFRDSVLEFLIKEGKVDQATADQICSWPHSGFGIDNGTVIAKNDGAGLERVAQYILRNPFSLTKMTYNEKTNTIIYRSKQDYHSKCNFKVFSAEDFIVAITQHIPAHGFQNVRYYGWYSNKARGQRLKQKKASAVPVDTGEGEADTAEVIDVSGYQPKKHASKKWRELIKKVWEVDPMVCPRCGKPMKVIALIDEPQAIFDILSYLGLWESVNEQARPRAPPPQQDRVASSSPGEPEDPCAVLYEDASLDGIDELPQDEVPTILYD
jgi:hypothetical protein